MQGGPPSLRTSRTREELWRVERKKFKMAEPFWGLGGLIIYGGAGLLEVAGVGGTAGGRVRNDPRSDGLIRNPP